MEYKQAQPIYLQIVDSICENILTRVWQEEERIPSVREMAIQYEVNPNTVMRAFTYLQERGIVYNQRGIGYFVSPGAYKATLELKREDFRNNDLPYFLKMMNLLNISIEYIRDQYKALLKEMS